MADRRDVGFKAGCLSRDIRVHGIKAMRMASFPQGAIKVGLHTAPLETAEEIQRLGAELVHEGKPFCQHCDFLRGLTGEEPIHNEGCCYVLRDAEDPNAHPSWCRCEKCCGKGGAT